MDLIEALEAMEPQDLHVRGDAKKRVDGDFFMQQVALVHERLKDQWTRQYRPAQPLHVPFAWVLSKTLRLLEEYPDGLTEAVILTELMTRLHQRERLTIKRARVPSIQELLNDNDDTVIEASIVDYAQHCLKLNVVDGVGLVRLFVHQRFRSCMMALAAILHNTPGLSAHFPFVPSRKVVLTNAKLMERRKDADAKEIQATLLPTPYLALLMDDTTDADRLMTQRAVGFREVDDMVRREQGQAETMLQQLIVRVRVADIGAIRPCTTPYHIHRQVILLSDVTVSPNSPVMASHVWILWDDQVALSRLFHVGDIVTILYPFVHICAPDDPELVSVFDEYLSQQRSHYYFEYGSATTLFITRRTQVPALTSVVASNNVKVLQQEEDSSSLRVSNASKDWIGFAVYGSVASIRVSHGIPLLAAYFHAYYDAKTRTDTSGTQRPTLDRAIISKYFLVVVLELYDAHSSEMLSVEVTGHNALKALQLRSGQTVYVEGLVAVDFRGNRTIRALRDEKAPHTWITLQAGNDASAAPAFPNSVYSSRNIALCSDWASLFGSQTDTFQESRLYVINEIPAVINITVARGAPAPPNSHTSHQAAMADGRFHLTRVGWLIPVDTQDAMTGTSLLFEWDETCQRGFSTMLAHKTCRRRLDMAPSSGQHPNSQPQWKCAFCNEIFAGMDQTIQTFCNLAVSIDDGKRLPLLAVCHGEAVATILGVRAEEFSQLRLVNKRSILRRALGKHYHVVISRFEELRLRPDAGLATSMIRQSIQHRLDQVQLVDNYACAQQLLTHLQR